MRNEQKLHHNYIDSIEWFNERRITPSKDHPIQSHFTAAIECGIHLELELFSFRFAYLSMAKMPLSILAIWARRKKKFLSRTPSQNICKMNRYWSRKCLKRKFYRWTFFVWQAPTERKKQITQHRYGCIIIAGNIDGNECAWRVDVCLSLRPSEHFRTLFMPRFGVIR